MNGFGYKKGGGSKVKKFALIMILPFVSLVLFYVLYKLFFIPAPVIEGVEAFRLLPMDKTVTLHGKNLKSVEIFITQGLKSTELLRDFPEDRERTYNLQVKPKDLGLLDGPAIVTVQAKSGILKKIKYKINTVIDTVPPALRVVEAPRVIYTGMGALAVLRADGADSVYVKLEDQSFRAYKAIDAGLKSAVNPDNTYLAFFPVPFELKVGAVFYAVAEDTTGNQVIRALPTKVKRKTFRVSSININDDFINRVVYPLLNDPGVSDPVSAFLKINAEWRERDTKRLVTIGQKSEPKILWKGRFLQLKNSKVMATYGDRRVYLYKGKPISRSVHLGYDLASVTNAPVEAANSGIVRFAGDLGIYGNAVIIDHGLGLMSLYGHLSEILVKEGTPVGKGEVIAKTGSSGFAGGDHLHFGILVHGVEVSPIYWWDQRWIKAYVLDLLK